MSSANPLTRFSNRVGDYVRYRPGYPPALLQSLIAEFGLTPRHALADIGSGTGISTAVFLANGNRVYGVEPNADMRAAAERELSAYAGFVSVDGRAEATTLPVASVDWVIAAQAFHWFDVAACRTEFARILRTGGRVALIWNDWRADSPFMQAYDAVIHEYATDYAQVTYRGGTMDARIRALLGDAHERRDFANPMRYDWDQVAGRLRSSSYMPAPDHPRFGAMMAALREVFDRDAVDGFVQFAYETQLFIGAV